jgi:hypothetical protein
MNVFENPYPLLGFERGFARWLEHHDCAIYMNHGYRRYDA